jgi:hypothetical protein
MKKTDETIAEGLGLGAVDENVKRKIAQDMKGTQNISSVLEVYACMDRKEAALHSFYLGMYFTLFTDNCKEMRAAAVLNDMGRSIIMGGNHDSPAH